MVNKGGALLIALALGGGAAAFSLRPGPEPAPQGFQGVVEYEERRLGFEQAGRLVHVEVERGDTVARHAVVAPLHLDVDQPARLLEPEAALLVLPLDEMQQCLDWASIGLQLHFSLWLFFVRGMRPRDDEVRIPPEKDTFITSYGCARPVTY